jgi:hypothetical protein
MRLRRIGRRRLIRSKIISRGFEDLRFNSNLHNSGRISGATNKGITIRARYLSTPRAHSGSSPLKLGPSIVMVRIWDHIVIHVAICIEPDRFLETWPPINRGQERPARGRLRLSQLTTSLFSNSQQVSPCLSESLPLSSSDALFPQSKVLHLWYLPS